MERTTRRDNGAPQVLVPKIVLYNPEGQKMDLSYDEEMPDSIRIETTIHPAEPSNQRNSLISINDMSNLVPTTMKTISSLQSPHRGFRNDLEFSIEAKPQILIAAGNSYQPHALLVDPGVRVDFEEPRRDSFAWQQVLCTFLLFFNTWGLINSFGLYQHFYYTAQSSSLSSISWWIGSSQGCLHLVVGVFTQQFYDMGYCRVLLISGSLLIAIGMMATSFCDTSLSFYPVLLLAQGICVGIGSGLLFSPSVNVLSTHFDQHYGVTVGILAMSGSSIGGIVYSFVFDFLQPLIGFAWTTRVITLIICLTLSFPVIFMEPRNTSKSHRTMFLDSSAFRDIPFILLMIGQFFAFMGLYIPYFYLPIYDDYCNYLSIPTTKPYIIPLLNGAALLGLLTSNILQTKIGPLTTTTLSLYILGAIGLCWTPVFFPAFTIIFSCIYGFFAGIILALLSNTIAALSPEDLVIPRIGMCAVVSGFGFLLGYPISQYLNRGKPCFGATGVFCGACLVVAAIILTAARFLKMRRKVLVRV